MRLQIADTAALSSLNDVLVLSQGFLLCASLIIAIGPQNLFVLQQGLRQQHLFATALLCTTADLLLIGLGVGGLGTFIAANKQLLTAITAGGASILFWHGSRSLLCAWRCRTMAQRSFNVTSAVGLTGTIAATLSFAFLNPLTYMDTVLLIGSASSQYPAEEQVLFGAGAVLASGLWFFTLTYAASRIGPLLSRPAAWRMLDAISGCIMFGIAFTMCAAMYAGQMAF